MNNDHLNQEAAGDGLATLERALAEPSTDTLELATEWDQWFAALPEALRDLIERVMSHVSNTSTADKLKRQMIQLGPLDSWSAGTSD